MTLRRVKPSNGQIVIGRGSAVDKARLVSSDNLLFNVGTVSKEHAIIKLYNSEAREGERVEAATSRVTIRDSGSRHGVVVNGRRLAQGCDVDLKVGDWIGLVAAGGDNGGGSGACPGEPIDESQCKCVFDFYGIESGELLFQVSRPVADFGETRGQPGDEDDLDCTLVDDVEGTQGREGTQDEGEEEEEEEEGEGEGEEEVEGTEHGIIIVNGNPNKRKRLEFEDVFDDSFDDGFSSEATSDSQSDEYSESEYELHFHADESKSTIDTDEHTEKKQKPNEDSGIPLYVKSGLIGMCVGASLGAGLTFSALLSVGRSIN
ncbi:FHA domain-containing protein CYBJADRAFT_167886 [Cyberlindnera jadinii NRRL Y-1542]|uniref:FHA domain-containing protein n=1 Tax=Cyberlindnera jadinii (strain ATCC 18201 / CBS 1600 / BCRC 20928 / JCM 3617 / NBRC 0987 / NRRL Y-1542) TaxID=983966 RepID=A0A1E4S1D3_CYBJN|nr:hypothetical protein CYBJADRAFT_167886 [Cyberlindnera jadinii NRRL Y-1542]ODV73299.1 hypothetical protein CYBJADRAFT_167886 [Cyberlindnera jadinii NRRL Y-1542]